MFSLLVLLCSAEVQAAPDVRSQEIAECRPGEIATWGDGVDRPALAAPLRLAYEHAGAPAWFASAELRSMLARAVNAWSACGVSAELLAPGASPPAGAIRVQWNAAAARDTFGLANLGQRTLSLNPDSFALLRQRNPRHDARQTLQMVISHEMGHFFGLMAHSRRCVDVTSYYHDGQGHQCLAREPALVKASPEYRAVLPTACDIARCRAANGFSSAPSEKR